MGELTVRESLRQRDNKSKSMLQLTRCWKQENGSGNGDKMKES